MRGCGRVGAGVVWLNSGMGVSAVVQVVGRVGGFLARCGDPNPGGALSSLAVSALAPCVNLWPAVRWLHICGIRGMHGLWHWGG